MAKLRKWIPLLDESQSNHVLASIHEIATTLENKLRGQERASLTAQLAEGAAGIAIFFAYLHTNGLYAHARELAFESINHAVDALAAQVMDPSLYAGFSGIAWAAQHVTDLLSDSSEDWSGMIDLALEKYLSHSPWKADYDLIAGLVGIGVYCLERSNCPVAQRCLELIIERLSELAQESGDEIRWFTQPDLLPPSQRKLYPRGYHNLGLAHGVPGIIALLGKTYAAGIAREKSGRLLEGAIRWLLRQRLHTNTPSSFPPVLALEQKPEDCRLAWCYGDAGLAAALLLAARCAGSKAWEDEALAIARRAAARDPESCRVMDACFCHGSSGLTHIFNRFYQATHDELFCRASCYWLGRTLQFCQPGSGAAGYSVLAPDEAGTITFQASFGLLEGVAGVGLSLLATVADVEPSWDGIFLVDVPPLLPKQ